MEVTYIKEQQKMSLNELQRLFEGAEVKVRSLIKDLISANVMKAVKKSSEKLSLDELQDEDYAGAEEIYSDNGAVYFFSYVGIIQIAGKLLICYPKYCTAQPSVSQMSLILDTVTKYEKSRNQSISFFNGPAENRLFNELAMFVFFYEDYNENGLYSNDVNLIETNGNGEILWDKTVNEAFAIISGNRPYYTELYTRKSRHDDFDFITRLHRAVLARASESIYQSGLSDMLHLSRLEFDENDEIEDLGDKAYILDRIEKEMNVQFNSRKQLLLKALYTYIARDSSEHDSECLSLYGTNAFNMVWETVCAEVLDSKLYTRVKDLKLPKPDENDNEMLIEKIRRPVWHFNGVTDDSQETLKPDYITVVDIQNETYFIIFDAKYYVISASGNKVTGNPGIESVSKQYLYQLAYHSFMREHGISKAVNCFLMPSEGEEPKRNGYVYFQIFDYLRIGNELINLEPIQLIMLPAETMYKHYLAGTHMKAEDIGIETNLEIVERQAVSAGVDPVETLELEGPSAENSEQAIIEYNDKFVEENYYPTAAEDITGYEPETDIIGWEVYVRLEDIRAGQLYHSADLGDCKVVSVKKKQGVVTVSCRRGKAVPLLFPEGFRGLKPVKKNG